jgi:hypothetical protein
VDREPGSGPAGGNVMIGRDRELGALLSLLDREGTVLAIIGSEPCMGKSLLLENFRRLAVQRGWNAPGSGDAFQITKDSTPEKFLSQLWQEIPAAGGLAPGELESGLRALSPLLLLIDGYEPDRSFSGWFQGVFLSALRTAGTQAVVVVAGGFKTILPLEHAADVKIALGPLDRAAVRAEIESAAKEISPPLGQAEIESYVEASSVEPELLGSFLRLFRLCGSRAV